MVKQTGGSVIFKLFNCFLLVSILVLLVYTVKLTADLKDKKENSGRVKRSTDDQGTNDQDVVHLGSATYTRWGRTICDAAETELVYSGVAGGSYHLHEGGGANYICLPMDPLWATYNDAVGNHAIVYGAEYELEPNDFPFSSANAEKLQDHNVPCAVCRTINRGSILMIPARNKCYEGWTEQYHGYLMAEHHTHKNNREFVCMDKDPEADVAGYVNENGALFYATEGACGSLPCPPYVAGRELTCVVCSK